ncbi:hypothetical protein COL5a_008914 [Colletotrichum fioriniae]|uniref:uncharacterized protein n=1 Tax=Colletotrichum fioriniae TaxID=710243 RepID=UPI0023005604|nr:uncharacterized protein COL516b_005532 [Colletotrichum fioriniae]KAJ0305298.1 hypothetical protein COL516b_005532 [Colletotrichum fioriniae]KAJ0321938.1 hypothetical protein COL5a_008914 [Colletotrichum fioriniae]KAJ3942798.1 hypothetical protein N0V96_007021 [Colletotrichum fioriniae]
MTGANNIRGLMGKGAPPTPTFFSIVRVAVLVLSLAVLASCAYCLSLLGSYSSSYTGPPGFMLFVSLFTLLVLGGAMILERFAAHFYFRIAVLIGYGTNCLFWLSGWAWSASIAALFLGDTCVQGTCFGPTTEEKRYGGSMAGAAAVGAVNWVLMTIVLFYYIKGCLSDPDCYGVSTGHGSEMGSIKAESKSRSQPSVNEP